MIVLDFEWNQGCGELALLELLQIGAVRLNDLGGSIVDTFNMFIKPVVHQSFHKSAKDLPDWEESVRSDVTFPVALQAFIEWCGEETIFAAWGDGDLDVLQQNCKFWNLNMPELKQVYDLQDAFSVRVGAQQRIALYKAVEYCGVSDSFVFHNALHDAMYTALVSGWLSWELLKSLPERKRRSGYYLDKLPAQKPRKVGPYRSVDFGLNSIGSRRRTCPICGAPALVMCWYSCEAMQFYASFRCKQHGKFICRLSLRKRTDGRWNGRLMVLENTPEVLAQFHRMKQEGDAHICVHQAKPYPYWHKKKK